MAALGLGLAALGRPGYMTVGHAADLPSTAVEAMRAHCHAMLDAAFSGGVRHVDAARSYGEAEAFLGSWLAARRPEGLTVSSKWGYRYTAGWQRDAAVHEVKDHSLAHLEAQWPESRARLGAALTVYQVHSATLESGVLDDGAVLDRLARLRDEEGVAVGLSVTGPRQPAILEKALGVFRGQRRLFDWVQATWNVLEPSAGPALAAAHDLGVRVITKEGLANGRLGPRGDVPAWAELAASHGLTTDQLALSVALAQPFIDVVLSGAATLAQLASNLQARPRALDVSAFALPPERFWAERSTLAWT